MCMQWCAAMHTCGVRRLCGCLLLLVACVLFYVERGVVLFVCLCVLIYICGF